MEMKRGDLVAIALAGDYGKPRPALVVQANYFVELPSVTVLPLTSELHDEHLLRIPVQPTKENGLRQPSQIMIDKISTVSRARVGKPIGRVDIDTMRIVDGAVARFLVLA
jgi:mRNA interferase MazF